MGRLDVTDIVLDPDFVVPASDPLAPLCTRNVETVGDNGRSIVTGTTTPFSATVLNDRGKRVQRTPDGERVPGNIVVFSKFRLIAGDDNHTADIVTWDGRTYTVVEAKSYSHFGRGFVRAVCELIPLAGGLPPS